MTFRFIILIFFCLPVTGFAVDPGGPNESLSRLWINHAIELIKEPTIENLSAVKYALDAAEEFYPSSPDGQYLLARILTDKNYIPKDTTHESPVRQAEELARESLKYEPGRQYSPRIPFRDRAIQYSLLALRLKNYSALLNNYESWPVGHRDSIPLIYAAARATLYLGLNEKAVRLAIRGESLTTERDSLAAFGLDLDDPLSAFRAIAVAAGDDKSIHTLDSALHRWGEALEEAIMPWIMSGIIDNHLIRKIHPLLNPSNKALADALLGIPVDLIIPHPERDYLNLARRLDITNEKDGIVSFNAEPSGNTIIYSGILRGDANYDGFSEEDIEISDGVVQSRRVDADQDGIEDWNIIYHNGNPVQVSLDNEKLIIIYREDAYPEIRTIINNNPEESIRGEAVFHTGAFSWEIGNGNPRFGKLDMPDWNDSSLWPYLKNVSIHAVLAKTGEIGQTTTWFVQGYPVRAREIRFSAINTEDPLWVRELLFDDGVKVAGRRSVRKMGNSRIWEFYERYEKGKFVGLAWSPGINGTPIYWQDWALEPWLRTQVWNLDADGWMDLRRFMTSTAGESAGKLFVGEARQEDLLPWDADSWEPWE